MKRTSVIEKVFCDLCGKDNYTFLDDFIFQNTTLTLVRCHECGLIYVNPRLTIEQRNIYFQRYMSGSVEDAQWWEKYRKPNVMADLKLLQRVHAKGKLLDVGCGYGFFLKEAQKREWETYGTEVSKAPNQYAQEKLGLDVRNCSLDQAGFSDNYFDVIALFDVIGYLQSPSQTLIEINRILKDEGTVIIRTLDRFRYVKLYNTLMSLFGRSRELEGNPFFENDRNYHFASQTLRKLLHDKGFWKVKVFNAKMGYWSSEKKIIRCLRRCFMLLADVIWFISAGKICLAPSITVVAKKEMKNL